MAEPLKRPAQPSEVDASPLVKPKSSSDSPPAETARAADSVPAAVGPFAKLPVKFGRYEIRKELGRGQMGAVYLAKDVELDRLIALKVARVSASGSAKILKRMEVEAKAAAKIDHPLICKVFDAGEIDGIRFIALQYIEGEDLKQYLKRVGRKRPVHEAVRLILQILRALEAAHAQGVIHRDLKPDNVMLNKNREPVIMDFGLARQTIASSNAGLTQGMIVGTAAYMSPEQAIGRAEDIDHRSDIYAAGTMLFEMLTGEWPFTGGAMEVMGKKCVQDPPSPLSLNPTLNPQLVAVSHKMIAKQKVDRYVTCAEAIDALQTIDLNVVATPQNPLKPLNIDFHSTNSVTPQINPAQPDPVFNFDSQFQREPIAASMVRGRSKIVAKRQVAPRRPDSALWLGFLKWWNTDPMAMYWTSLIGLAAITPIIALTLFLIPRNGVNRSQERVVEDKSVVTTGDDALKSPQSSKVIASQTTGMQFALIPAGEFTMGCRVSDGELATKFNAPDTLFQDEFPSFRAAITKPFYMGVHEVTVGHFRQFVKSNNYRTDAETTRNGNSGFDESNGTFSKEDRKFILWNQPGFLQTDDHPVVNVSWNDAQHFCEWLSGKDGVRYRLPTEAEWEYACKAGSTTLWSNGDVPEDVVHVGNISDEAAKEKYPHWKAVNARDGYVTTAPVGRFAPNAFGLYDMHGNVWEWCEDCYDSKAYRSRSGLIKDPIINKTDCMRVLRGGSWHDDVEKTLSTYRSGGFSPQFRDGCFGFRVVREVASEPFAAAKLEDTSDVPAKVENPKSAEAEFVAIFNGKNLTGWSIDGGSSGQWKVENGEIIGQSRSWKERSYLLTKDAYSDFVLQFEFKIEGEKASAGTAIRAVPGEYLPIKGNSIFDHPLIKLRHAANGEESLGSSYWITAARTCVPAVVEMKLSPTLWHRMEVQVRKDSCTATVGDKIVTDLMLGRQPKGDFVPALARHSGKVGFQINTGTLHLRNIEIKKLN